MSPTVRHVPVDTARVTARAKRYVAAVLESGRLSYGPFSERLETMMAEAHAIGSATFCNSGTSALQCALAALREVDGWVDGDEVIVPAVSFVASANVVLASGLTPRFVDVDPRTYGLDPTRLAEAIGPRTRAVMPVHLFGLPCDMEPILAITRRHGLRVVEDSCETMFVAYRGSDTGHFVFERVGFSYRASELEAALGVAQMEERDEMLATRRRHAATLSAALAGAGSAVQLPWCPADREHAFAMYPLVVADETPAKTAVVAALAERGIESRDFLPLLSQPVYRGRFGDLLAKLPVARRLDASGFYVGCHDGLGADDVAHLAAVLVEVLAAKSADAPRPAAMLDVARSAQAVREVR